MKKRITIIMDCKLDKKIKVLQKKEIIKTGKSVSYSSVLNSVLRKSVKQL